MRFACLKNVIPEMIQASTFWQLSHRPKNRLLHHFRYNSLLALLGFFGSLQGAPSQHPPHPIESTTLPYDADLFKRDTPVFSLHTSLLYWRVQEGSLDYALKMGTTAPSGNSYAIGHFHKARFDGDPGFRVALSYFRAPHYWELWAQYTRFTTRGTDQVKAPQTAGKYLVGTFPQIFANPLSQAKSAIHLNYNVGDLSVDRFFNPNPHLRIRFIGSTSVAWINQDWNVDYLTIMNEATNLKHAWKFIGGGLRLGTTVDWFCGHDLYLTSGASCALFVGSYENTTKQTATNSLVPYAYSCYQDARAVFTIQGLLGLSWQKNFPANRVEVFGGYEVNSWFNLQEVYRSKANSAFLEKETAINTGLLALQGLTARITVDF